MLVQKDEKFHATPVQKVSSEEITWKRLQTLGVDGKINEAEKFLQNSYQKEKWVRHPN